MSSSEILIIFLSIMNAYGIISMWYDKKCAIAEKRRTPEKTLFTIAACGGALGIFIGMYAFRHKTLHLRFVIGIPILFIFNLFCIYYIVKYVG